MTNVDRLRAFCLRLDGAWEDHPWDHTVFKVKTKIFAFVAESAVTVKSTLEKQAALILHPHIDVAAYVGRYGWVTLDLAGDGMLDLAEDLILESYESVLKRKAQPSRSARSGAPPD